MVVSTEANRRDYLEFVRAASQGPRPGDMRAVGIAHFIGFVMLGAALGGSQSPERELGFAAIVLIVVARLIGQKLALRTIAKDGVLDGGPFLGRTLLTTDDVGISTRTGAFRSQIPWAGVVRVEETKHLVLIFVDGMSAVVVPKRDFESEDFRESFVEHVRTSAHAARGTHSKD